MNRLINIFHSLLIALFILAISPALWANDEIAELKVQLTNLKSQLNQAENIPGTKGLERVRYYYKQVTFVEDKLKKMGVDPAKEEQENTPWEDSTQSQQKLSPESHSLLKEYRHELLKVDHKLRWVVGQFDLKTANQAELNQQMAQLIQERKKLRSQIQTLLNNPSLEIAARQQGLANAQQAHDTKLKDPHLIRHLQESLQQVYRKIFTAHQKSLKTGSGEEILKLGQEITKLEQKEKQLKKRLRNLDQAPWPPKVLHDIVHDQPLPTNDTFMEKDYYTKVEAHLALLEKKMAIVRAKVKKATSGNDLSNLGRKLELLQHEYALIAHNIHDKEKMKEAQKAAPDLSLQGAWGAQKDVPAFYRLKEGEKAHAGNWGQKIAPRRPQSNGEEEGSLPAGMPNAQRGSAQNINSMPQNMQPPFPNSPSSSQALPTSSAPSPKKLWDVSSPVLERGNTLTARQNTTDHHAQTISRIWGQEIAEPRLPSARQETLSALNNL